MIDMGKNETIIISIEGKPQQVNKFDFIMEFTNYLKMLKHDELANSYATILYHVLKGDARNQIKFNKITKH